MAVDCGADALGFVFAKSPRKISVKDARSIVRSLGPWISTVGVFVDETPVNVKKIAKFCGLSAVQLHGNEPPKGLDVFFPLKVIKAFRVFSGKDLQGLGNYTVDAFLFDAKVDGQYGGTGKSFDWNILTGTKAGRPLILSGGLSPENVRQAIRVVRPYGVDVSSGVEKSPGKKDPEKVRKFIINAKEN